MALKGTDSSRKLNGVGLYPGNIFSICFYWPAADKPGLFIIS
jgi:hypothetical protein